LEKKKKIGEEEMSFLQKRGFSHYRIQKLNISTRDKFDTNQSDLEYVVALPEAISNVVSISLVDYSFPTNLFASFNATNDTLDFSLQNNSLFGGVPTVFSITFPHKKYKYYDKINTDDSYLHTLVDLMNDALNVSWRLRVRFSFIIGNNFQTFILAKTLPFTSLPSDSTNLTFLFASGPNKARTACVPMGFFPGNDVFSSLIINTADPVQMIEAPLQSNLTLNKYVDIFIDENGPEAIKRVFASDETYTTNFFSIENVLSLDVITNNPPRNVDKLHIRITHDRVQPDEKDFPHALTLHIVSLDNGVLSIPSYIHQRFTY